jgi:hypothetical protein
MHRIFADSLTIRFDQKHYRCTPNERVTSIACALVPLLWARAYKWKFQRNGFLHNPGPLEEAVELISTKRNFMTFCVLVNLMCYLYPIP